MLDETPVGAAIGGPRAAWLIGGLQFVSVSSRKPLGKPHDDYEAVTFDPEREAWPIACAHRAPEDASSLLVSRRIDPVQEDVFRVLLAAGRIPLHAALVTPGTQAGGVLILGDSGRGKSSLVWLAVSKGWRVVSDDLIALRSMASGETVGVTVRKRLRIAAHLVDATTRPLGRSMRTHDGLQKIRLDPDVLWPGAFLREAQIDRIAFLERAVFRSITPISRMETLERLIALCSAPLTLAHSRAPFDLLTDLARRADARVASLTRDCLSDPHVLAQLAA